MSVGVTVDDDRSYWPLGCLKTGDYTAQFINSLALGKWICAACQ